MSTPIVTARRNLAQRISPVTQSRGRRDRSDTLAALSGARGDHQLEEERFAEGERMMSEAELPNLYEPAGFVTDAPIDRRHLVDQLTAVVAAA
jgi:hypothetical protein